MQEGLNPHDFCCLRLSEPEFTNYTGNYTGCLDYLFYTDTILRVRQILEPVDSRQLFRVRSPSCCLVFFSVRLLFFVNVWLVCSDSQYRGITVVDIVTDMLDQFFSVVSRAFFTPLFFFKPDTVVIIPCWSEFMYINIFVCVFAFMCAKRRTRCRLFIKRSEKETARDVVKKREGKLIIGFVYVMYVCVCHMDVRCM